MKEAHLRDFIAVIDEGGVRAAARKLGLTQAAVSRNLLALERECGQSLLMRSSHGIELTEAGRILLRRARAADTELRRAREELDALAGRTRGGVSVGLSPAVEAALMPRAIERFRQAHPDVQVRVTGGVSVMTSPLLREGRLDFIIGSVGNGSESGFVTERLMSVDLAIVTRRGHPRQNATTLEELEGYEWITGASTTTPEAELSVIFGAQGLPPPRVGIQRESSGVMHLLVGSDRLALITLSSVQLYCDAGLLQIVPVRVKLPSIVMYLVTVEGRPLTAQAIALAAEFRRAARAWRR